VFAFQKIRKNEETKYAFERDRVILTHLESDINTPSLQHLSNIICIIGAFIEIQNQWKQNWMIHIMGIFIQDT